MINSPIGVFDSGIGGISVLKELVDIMPSEDFLYLGDTDNAPYGSKSVNEVRELTLKAVDKLIEYGSKAIVIACNTATSAAISLIRNKHSTIPVIGLEPALKPAITFKKNPVVLVLATPVTLREKKFNELAESFKETGKIIPVPCDHLAEIIENGHTEDSIVEEYIQSILEPYMKEKPDAVVLGCTHYPLAIKTFRKLLPENVSIFDGGKGAARETQRRLAENNLLKITGKGTIRFISENYSNEHKRFAERVISNGIFI